MKTLNENELKNVAGGEENNIFVCMVCSKRCDGHRWHARHYEDREDYNRTLIVCDSCHSRLKNDPSYTDWYEYNNL